MSSISNLLNKKVPLPSIQSLVSDMPQIDLNLSNPDAQNQSENNGQDFAKSSPYTLVDDLSIFSVIVKYYGDGFHGKIPWSFWQTYKRVSGSNRSNSSLYHHWNGAMRKKYESFITTGRLMDCISWLEAAVNAERNQNRGTDIPHSGTPLLHNRSEPSVPLLPPGQKKDAPSPLIRTLSCAGGNQFSFFPPN